MALVTPIPAMGERAGSMRFHGIGSPGSRSSRSGIMDEPVSRLIEEKIFVAVDKHVAKSKSTLIWALQNTGGKKICLVHVHQPSQMIPVMGAKFPVGSVKDEEVRVFREKERAKVHMILDDYLRICQQRGVRAEKMFIEMESIENGIVQLISELGIRKLVMGAAADRHYSRRMTDLKSRKAIFVRREAPTLCHIWFTCKGYLIHTREATMDDTESEYASPRPSISASDLLQTFSTPESEHQHISRVQSTDSIQHFVSNGSSTEHSGRVSDGSLNTDEEDRESDGSEVTGSATVMSTVDENSGHSSPSNFPDGVDDSFNNKIRKATSEAHSSKQEAFAETLRRQKAEKNALDAIRRAKQSESAYSEELKRRKDTEIAVAKEKERFVTIKNEQEVIMEELQSAMDQKAMLESQIAESDGTMEKLNQKLDIAVKLLQKLKDEREELQTERDRALREAEELRGRAETSTLQLPQYFTDFSFSEIEEATNHFDSTLKIGEGGYGSIYVGILRHTQVAIKMLNPNSSQGPVEYQQEVDVLSKMRHPNIITLIGACPEGWSLVYEYLPDGSLEDRINCKDNSPPLSWQNRVRIATEICAALVFLHSNKAHSLVHGDLKPANILLDSNLVSKLSDFGTCSLLHPSGSKSVRTDLTATGAYLDPEASSSGELTPKSDVYSFGIILLRLLTGRPATRISNEVKYALDNGSLNDLLDPLAGDWPFVQAEQLARLALRCCETVSENRPDLGTEVWRVLEPMRASSGGSSSFHLGRNEHRIAPPYFICPIFQEVMQDPHVAADGFTYEAEAIRAWLDSEHDTSPMTNVKLSHTSLIANHALRSAIQEWLQHHC
ncbi:PREDICTED: U-box domain-containing protein 33 [Camelina sativa]|uniref:RING-type E3 ubiquitin transferase n=1 Tax=Camelina sativa TaxID=90675 RepID=A0ABM0YYY0_CAMSA|nr:PREDICTED: U-box domain-containing protein 33 [Camelina sativa]XP_010508095.1 PREDICTED: U-box domain-containing protein 33 [Camelina sativa]